ncbi:MAG TPA: RNA polymerase sigma factor [Gemmataceae bacterium]|nr:RNA polymerase sigma factor [Gemmataceae bacterium]
MDERSEFAQLLARLRTGDPSATGVLCERYGPFIRAAVRRQLHPRLRTRFDSLDFVQDVWASFLAIPAERYTFETPQALLAFLNRVAYNKVVEVFRQRFETQKDDVNREVSVDQRDGGRDRLPSTVASPSQWAVAGEEWERLLSRFPVGHRTVLLRLREGYSHEDIASMANVSLSTVNRIVRRLKDLTSL